MYVLNLDPLSTFYTLNMKYFQTMIENTKLNRLWKIMVEIPFENSIETFCTFFIKLKNCQIFLFG